MDDQSCELVNWTYYLNYLPSGDKTYKPFRYQAQWFSSLQPNGWLAMKLTCDAFPPEAALCISSGKRFKFKLILPPCTLFFGSFNSHCTAALVSSVQRWPAFQDEYLLPRYMRHRYLSLITGRWRIRSGVSALLHTTHCNSKARYDIRHITIRSWSLRIIFTLKISFHYPLHWYHFSITDASRFVIPSGFAGSLPLYRADGVFRLCQQTIIIT